MALLERRARQSKSPRLPPGRSRHRRGAPSSSSSSLSLLPPSAHGLLCPVAAAASSLLAPRAAAAARAAPVHLAHQPARPGRSSGPRSSPPARALKERFEGSGKRGPVRPSRHSRRRPAGRAALGCVCGAGSRRPKLLLPYGSGSCICFRLSLGRQETLANGAQSELGVFSSRVWLVFPWSLTIPHCEPC